MEVILAIVIVVLAGLGLGLGVVVGRGPARTSCGAAACVGQGACEVCPRRRAEEGTTQ